MILYRDILIRYKNLKRIYGYKIDTYWSNISTAGVLLQNQHGFPEGRKSVIISLSRSRL